MPKDAQDAVGRRGCLGSNLLKDGEKVNPGNLLEPQSNIPNHLPLRANSKNRI